MFGANMTDSFLNDVAESSLSITPSVVVLPQRLTGEVRAKRGDIVALQTGSDSPGRPTCAEIGDSPLRLP
jgi:hypothetical protein